MNHQEIAEKFKTGEYIIIWKCVEPITLNCTWNINGSDRLFPGIEYKLIHKKDKEVLEAHLNDSSVAVVICVQDSVYQMNLDFIETYDERNNYKIMELK